MAKTPQLPPGVSLYRDQDGEREFYRVRLGTKFLGKGRKAEKKAFPTHSEAVKWIKAKDEELHPHAAEAEATGLTPQQIAEVRVALAKLEGMASLVDAADAWLKHEKPVLDSVTVTDAIAALVAMKKKRAKSDKSKRHNEDLHNKLTRFFRGRGNRKISDISPADIDTLLDVVDARGNEPSDSQIVRRFRYARILVRFAIGRGWIAHDRSPLRAVELPELIGDEIIVLTPKQVATLLITARDKFPCILPALVIKIFSGIRQTELYRLTWDGVGKKKITVTAAHAKTNRRRTITIPDTLSAWLESLRKDKGLVYDCEPQRADRIAAWHLVFDPLRAAAGFEEWPQNALRHSFGSYHFALHQNENLTSAEMGNSPAVCRANYVEAIKDETACERYWELSPANVDAAAEEEKPTPESLQEPKPRRGTGRALIH